MIYSPLAEAETPDVTREPMNILMLHNSYQFRGGEDESFESEVRMLRDAGHYVDTIHLNNDRVDEIGKFQVALQSIWSKPSYDLVDRKLRERNFDVMHVQNFFPMISPSVYSAAKKNGVPVVQTLRNYRLLCPSTVLYRDGHICEDCLHKTFKIPGIVHGCYRDSVLSSAAVAAMTAFNALKGTWRNDVDLYICLTAFSRQKFVEAGFNPDKVIVKSNFVYPDPGAGDGENDYLLFAGRLTREKGVETLLSAWQRVKSKGTLKIIGEGPLESRVREFVAQNRGVEWLGPKSSSEVKQMMGAATALVFPSEWYEPFGRVAIESFAKGTPVITSRLAGMVEIVRDGQTGLLFNPGDPEDLAQKMDWAIEHPDEIRTMRRAARAEYQRTYTIEQNLGALIHAYRTVGRSPVIAAEPYVAAKTTN
ncbi:MAG: glycosyltransferase family 4 protein [Candidatus Acidiferrales bacterium]